MGNLLAKGGGGGGKRTLEAAALRAVRSPSSSPPPRAEQSELHAANTTAHSGEKQHGVDQETDIANNVASSTSSQTAAPDPAYLLDRKSESLGQMLAKLGGGITSRDWDRDGDRQAPVKQRVLPDGFEAEGNMRVHAQRNPRAPRKHQQEEDPELHRLSVEQLQELYALSWRQHDAKALAARFEVDEATVKLVLQHTALPVVTMKKDRKWAVDPAEQSNNGERT
eukprot:jgi/Chlat1/5638/Chrsp369S00864